MEIWDWLDTQGTAEAHLARDEITRLRTENAKLRRLATCGCGDTFTEHDPGTCGNCLAGLDRASEVEWLRDLLTECAPHALSAAEAEHLLDGFRPQRRPLDDLADRVREFMGPNAGGQATAACGGSPAP